MYDSIMNSDCEWDSYCDNRHRGAPIRRLTKRIKYYTCIESALIISPLNFFANWIANLDLPVPVAPSTTTMGTRVDIVERWRSHLEITYYWYGAITIAKRT